MALPDTDTLAVNVDLSDGFDASDPAAIREYLNALAAGTPVRGHVGRFVYAGQYAPATPEPPAPQKTAPDNTQSPQTGDTSAACAATVVLLLSGGWLVAVSLLRKTTKRP